MDEPVEHAQDQDGPDLSALARLPEIIGFEVTRILESARIAAEQIRAQAREESARVQEESAEVRRKIAHLRAEFAGLLQHMGRFTEQAVEEPAATMVVVPEATATTEAPVEVQVETPAATGQEHPEDGQVLGDERHAAATEEEVEATFWNEAENGDGLTVLERLRRLAAN